MLYDAKTDSYYCWDCRAERGIKEGRVPYCRKHNPPVEMKEVVVSKTLTHTFCPVCSPIKKKPRFNEDTIALVGLGLVGLAGLLFWVSFQDDIANELPILLFTAFGIIFVGAAMVIAATPMGGSLFGKTCPVCHERMHKTGSGVTSSNYLITRWKCPACGLEGGTQQFLARG
jgi:hypothetical protein